MKPPRYDEVFAEGTRWLDEVAMDRDERKSYFYTAISELIAAARAYQSPQFRDRTIDLCINAMKEHDTERAVIEAARAWALVARFGDAEDFERPLLTAVNALEAAEEE